MYLLTYLHSLLSVLAAVGWRCGKKWVVRVAQCVVAIVTVHVLLSFSSSAYRFFDPSGSSDSLSKTVDASQLITWFSWLAWSIKAYLFCSERLDGHWLLVKGFSVVDLQMDQKSDMHSKRRTTIHELWRWLLSCALLPLYQTLSVSPT